MSIHALRHYSRDMPLRCPPALAQIMLRPRFRPNPNNRVPLPRLTPLAWILAAFVVLAVTEHAALHTLAPLEHRLSDSFIRLHAGGLPPDPEVVLVDIDDASLARMAELADRWPWPRSVHGELAAGIAAQGPKAIVFDVMFAEPDRSRPEHDELLNDMLRPLHNVYFPTARLDAGGDGSGALLREVAPAFAMLETRDAQRDAQASLLLPYALAPENWRLGLINLLADEDGVARRYYLHVPAYGWKIPSMPARVAADLGYPLPEGESILLGWRSMTRTRVPFVELYEDFNREHRQRPAAEFKDKIVVIGTAATGLNDLRVTPMSEFHPGADILATAIENLKNRSYMRAAPAWVPLIVTLLVLALVYSAFHRGYNTVAVGAGVALAGVLLLIGSYVAVTAHVVLPLLTPVALMIALFGASTLYTALHERRERLKAVDFFSRFVNPHVVRDLLQRGGIPERGESREITVLFSDIRGFTSLSETRKPEEIVELLNRYFGRQVEVIFRHSGSLDKFIGDAIMAFWGAPLDDPDHAKHAVMAALDMSDNLEAFKRDLGDAGKAFDVGIGLNSGPAVVGIIGSENKREYTAIGDTINLGSRIEGLTKGVARILVSEETMRRCQDAFDFIDHGQHAVKGREQPVRLFEPVRRTS
jgi:adenylate cyclase